MIVCGYQWSAKTLVPRQAHQLCNYRAQHRDGVTNLVASLSCSPTVQIVHLDLHSVCRRRPGQGNRTEIEPERRVRSTQLRRVGAHRRPMHHPVFPPPISVHRLRIVSIPSPSSRPATASVPQPCSPLIGPVTMWLPSPRTWRPRQGGVAVKQAAGDSLRKAVWDRLAMLDDLAANADDRFVLSVARNQLPRLTSAWRAVLILHAPDLRGRCPTCSTRWQPQLAPCSVWQTAQEHLTNAPTTALPPWAAVP